MRHSPLNDDGPHWWSSIASELETSIAELPRLIRRVDEVLTAEHITDSQEFEAESILERIEIVLRDIQTTINSEENKARRPPARAPRCWAEWRDRRRSSPPPDREYFRIR